MCNLWSVCDASCRTWGFPLSQPLLSPRATTGGSCWLTSWKITGWSLLAVWVPPWAWCVALIHFDHVLIVPLIDVSGYCSWRSERSRTFILIRKKMQMKPDSAVHMTLLSHCRHWLPLLSSKLGDKDWTDGIQLREDQRWHGTERLGRRSEKLQKEQGLVRPLDGFLIWIHD